MKRTITILLAFSLLFTGAAAHAEAEDALPQRIDMTKWQYEADADVYWQAGLAYAANPADASYETMGIFVPGAYFTAEENGDGTYTCAVNGSGAVSGYTAADAPYILPVNTPGYSAMAAPSGIESSMGYGSITDYTGAGMIVLFAGARGRDAGAPAGVTDFKAAIRYARWNADLLPGDTGSLFTLGMSGGGAQSAVLGATGDSELYAPYLEAIGAVMTESDAVTGSMCWCPITGLDVADEAYEWNMGNTRSGLTEEEQAYSDGMAEAFAAYVNALGLTDGNGTPLMLCESAEGLWQDGTYYAYVKDVIETSLEHFLGDTEFPYTASSSRGDFGGPGRQAAGQAPDGAFPGTPPEGGSGPQGMNGGAPSENAASYEDMDGIARGGNGSSALSLSGTYETKQDYVDALNANGEWVLLDGETGEVTITSVAAFTAALKNASKGIAAFDQLDRGQGENTLFGYGDGSGAHFDATLAQLAAGREYGEAFAEDLARTDALGNTVDVRLNMYTPLYFLLPSSEGYGTSAVAKHWRIRTGITQGDTALCTEIDLALALDAYGEDTRVDFETVWGQGHTQAERTGSAVPNFIAWVRECTLADAA